MSTNYVDEPKPVKKAAKKRAVARQSVDVSKSGTRRTGTEVVRSTSLIELGNVINGLPGVVTAVTEGLIEGDAGWLVSWEEVDG